ncbi:hypothetical protein DMUE_5024 [Dictyocoela muelleri]|nr:hypothetical protein DMUE_5024 [Dictyocoela muelleri]
MRCFLKNRNLVINNSSKYSKEFKYKNLEEFNSNQKVIIRNKTKRTKMENEFRDISVIIKKLINNTYEIMYDSGKTFIRHGSQIKTWPGLLDVLNPHPVIGVQIINVGPFV